MECGHLLHRAGWVLGGYDTDVDDINVNDSNKSTK